MNHHNVYIYRKFRKSQIIVQIYSFGIRIILHVTLRSTSHLRHQRIVQIQHYYIIHANLIKIMYAEYVGVNKKKV